MRTLSLALGLSLCGCATVDRHLPVERPSSADAEQQALVQFMQAAAESGFSGTFRVARDHQTIASGPVGSDPSIKPDARFWIGSLTKPITAAAVLRLEELAKLALTDPISRHLPGVPADKKQITIRHLLTHTSGLPHAYEADGVADRDQAVAAILQLPLRGRLGEFRYSNDGYTLLAAIIEIASGESYEAFVRRTVFDRADMTQSGFWPGSEQHQFATVAETPRGAAATPNWGYRGATGIYSTAEDLERFSKAFFSGRIVSTDSVERATTAQIPNEEPSYGFGWFVMPSQHGPVIFHSGAESGIQHYAWLRWYPVSETTIILLSNSPREIASPTSKSLVDVVFRLLGSGKATDGKVQVR